METPKAEVERSRAETRAAFENRAHIYASLLAELESEIGIELAVRVMKRAIYARGLEVGRKYAAAAEAGDLEEVGRLFCEGSPAGGALFRPAVQSCAPGTLVLSMSACPLVDAWREAGLSPERIDLLCEISAAVDEGAFEGAGLELEFRERAGEQGSRRCVLDIHPVSRGGHRVP